MPSWMAVYLSLAFPPTAEGSRDPDALPPLWLCSRLRQPSRLRSTMTRAIQGETSQSLTKHQRAYSSSCADFLRDEAPQRRWFGLA